MIKNQRLFAIIGVVTLLIVGGVVGTVWAVSRQSEPAPVVIAGPQQSNEERFETKSLDILNEIGQTAFTGLDSLPEETPSAMPRSVNGYRTQYIKLTETAFCLQVQRGDDVHHAIGVQPFIPFLSDDIQDGPCITTQ